MKASQNIIAALCLGVICICVGNVNAGGNRQENSFSRRAILKSETTNDPWLGKDKLQHFLVSGFLTAYGYVFLNQTVKSPESSATYISTFSVTGLGITKEIYDLKSKKGHPGFKDILANLLGVGTALFFIKVL